MPSKSRGTGNLVSGNILNPDLTTGYVGIGSTYPEAKLDVDGNVKVSGIVSATSFVGLVTSSQTAGYSIISGISTIAVKLQTPRTIQLTGDIFTSPQPFDGSQNLSIASSITQNSVGLGTHTTGDYVKNITGTTSQIQVSVESGEGSSPQISFPNSVVIPQNLLISNDLQVNNNLNVSGNITIGGTVAYIVSNDFIVKDADVVLGFTTDSYGNEASNDTTANHGGIAVASTEGTPLVTIYDPSIGEINPSTYKKIMWFKQNATGLGTDAWLINYAVGIGSTQFPTGTRLAAGSVQFTQNDLSVIRNINSSGVVTATSFVGNLVGIASTATNLANAANITTGTISTSRLSGTYNINVSYATTSGVSTVAQGLTGTPNINVGVATATSFVGNLVGIASTATNLANAANITTGTISTSRLSGTYNINVSYATTSGVSTVAQGLTGTPNINVGVATATSFVGNLVGIASTATNLANAANITTGTISTSRLSGFYDVNVSYATTSGVSTVAQGLTGTPNINVGVATATSFVGNLVGIASTATNLANAANITTGTISTSRLSGFYDVNVSYATTSGVSTVAQGLTGTPNINVGVATATSFVGNLVGIASTATNLANAANITTGTISTSRLSGFYDVNVSYATTAGVSTTSTNVIGGIASVSSINVSGISTLGSVLISSGIITAASGIVTYYGDGSKLSNTISGVSISTNTSNVNQFIPYTVGIGTTTGFGINNGLVYNPSSGNLGIGSEIPSSKLDVVGNARISGILTASSFFGDGSGLTGVTAVGSGVEIRSNGSPIGVAATINFGSELTTVLSSGIATVTTPIYWIRTASGINTTSNVGIGTTNPSQNLHVQGNVRITGGLYDSNNNVGAAGSVLTSTGAGTSWSSPRSTSILHGTTTNIKRSNTTYFSFGGTANATESIMSIALPATGTLSNLYIKLSAAAGAVGTGYTFTVRKNSAATSVVVTIAGTSTGGSDLVNSTSFTSGDLFSIEAKPSSTLPTDNLEVYWTARYVI